MSTKTPNTGAAGSSKVGTAVISALLVLALIWLGADYFTGGDGDDNAAGTTTTATPVETTVPDTPVPFPAPTPAPAPDDDVLDRFQVKSDDVETARYQLGQLSIGEKDPEPEKDDPNYEDLKFNREAQFGKWGDGNISGSVGYAQNGCDSRNDILNRDMEPGSVEHMDGGCKVGKGRLYDPYGTKDNPTNHWIDFQHTNYPSKGAGNSGTVDVDHVVALKDAWRSGAREWDQQKRIDFANDPINLIAVDGPSNRAKGDKDASEWVPYNKPIQCFYAASQIQVKHKYNLRVTVPEKQALSAMIDRCPTGV